ncbi:MAG: hypothetical protein SPG61_00675, partial [Arcanobacterium sp.]|nr:hypothetical protein [Arcanobacterium sp.]
QKLTLVKRIWPIVQFLLWGFFAAAILAILLISMEVRWEKPDLTPATPSAFEDQRQNLAITATQIEHAANTLKLSDLANTAQTWVTELNGVWVPWPDGAPEGYKNPQLQLQLPSIDAASLAQALIKFGEESTLLPEKYLTTFQTTNNQNSENTDSTKVKISTLTAMSAKQTLEAFTHAQKIIDTNKLELTLAEFDYGDLAHLAQNQDFVQSANALQQLFEVEAAKLLPEQRKTLLEKIASLEEIFKSADTAGISYQRSPLALEFTPEPSPITQFHNAVINAVSTLEVSGKEKSALLQSSALFLVKISR